MPEVKEKWEKKGSIKKNLQRSEGVCVTNRRLDCQLREKKKEKKATVKRVSELSEMK